jgi:hypothetical protein
VGEGEGGDERKVVYACRMLRHQVWQCQAAVKTGEKAPTIRMEA